MHCVRVAIKIHIQLITAVSKNPSPYGAHAATNLKPVLSPSVAPLFFSVPSAPTTTYCLLDAAIMLYTPVAAPCFCRITKISQADAVARLADSVYVPL